MNRDALRELRELVAPALTEQLARWERRWVAEASVEQSVDPMMTMVLDPAGRVRFEEHLASNVARDIAQLLVRERGVFDSSAITPGGAGYWSRVAASWDGTFKRDDVEHRTHRLTVIRARAQH